MSNYLQQESEMQDNIKMHSALKSIYIVRNKQEKYSFKNMSVLIPEWNIQLKDFDDKYNFSVSDCLALANLYNDMKVRLFLNYYLIFGKEKQQIRFFIDKLTGLRNKIAHDNDISIDNLPTYYAIDVHSIASSHTKSDNVLVNNIYWISNILIPFLEEYSSDIGKDEYIILDNILKYES